MLLTVEARPIWWRLGRSLLGLGAVTFGVLTSVPAGGWTGGALLVLAATLPICVAGWLTCLFAPPASRLVSAGLLAMVTAGLVLTLSAPNGVALVFPAVACAVAGAAWPPRWSIGLTALTATAFVIARTAAHGWSPPALVGPAAVTGGLLLGLIRRQSTRLAEETALARDEQARAALLGERARLAREIHDVLAHTLSALSVQLETADALLENERTEQARQSVDRASRLAREGLAETRRAIGALRGEALPLSEMLDRLAADYRTDLGGSATVRVAGPVRTLNPDATLALYRTAQEAMTNVRKHAPGAAVTIGLTYRPDEVSLRVDNAATPNGTVRPLASTGGGYGLAGLRERAELFGGTFTAEPTGDGYRIEIRLAA